MEVKEDFYLYNTSTCTRLLPVQVFYLYNASTCTRLLPVQVWGLQLLSAGRLRVAA